MEMRVKDGGKSESQVVITWIRLELTGDISRRENGQTSTGSSSTRRLEKLFKEEKQMAVMKRIAATAAEFNPEPLAELMTGASSHSGEGWHAINWQQVNRNVKRLQARIVQAMSICARKCTTYMHQQCATNMPQQCTTYMRPQCTTPVTTSQLFLSKMNEYPITPLNLSLR